MGFYSSHIWNNGAVLTAERVSPSEIAIRIQDHKENMLADFLMGEHEAMCLMHAISSVLSKKEEQEYNTAIIRKRD
jgi:hypothetical protein